MMSEQVETQQLVGQLMAASRNDEKAWAGPAAPPRWPHSERIELIAAALAKAQLQIKGAVKDSQNPHFKSQYADLSSVWDACHEHLNANGICVVQQTELLDGQWRLVTRLIHTSGQWFRNEWPVRPQQDTPQGLGSAVTYARRYSLAAIAGVAPRGDDDDGNAASQPAQAPPQKKGWNDLPPPQASNDDPPPQGKPTRPAPVELADLPETITSLPADVAKLRREFEPYAEKPFAALADPEIKGIARALDALAAKATSSKNKMVLATLAATANAEVGKRVAGGAK